ncbi:DUF3298 and DUF4163 domain-containing protein [Hwangdonia lutea]|uniref:DUF3298 and DUF4163 domain-containing protein n=1 Tax=Hwangdonia lutea TaxID=3075823 RepID=A0AA97ENY1_9FLAO|nr:DUF3298 and DUF4163 domain-containing protein [Hwangdonia sp. SCSIO 19198]WOD44906.1 DUF3298 and DUF4163 domain-containing protein [Hwangdonia sp. SCSIO 19198]
MFKNKYLLLTCVFYMFFSCKTDKPINFTETNITSENNQIVEINIPLANTDNDAAKSINAATKDYVIKALQIGESNNTTEKSVEESIEDFNQEYTDFINDFPESTQKWEAQIDGEVIFKAQDIISISLTSYTNTGGAHGNLNISFLNFDTSTGKLLDTNALFTDIEGFKSMAKKHFEASIKDKDLLLDPETFQLPENIGYSDDGIILLYNTYEIAPYSSGILEFSIPFEDAKPYLVFNRF